MYNSMFDVAFTVKHSCNDPIEVPVEMLLAALQQRLDYLKANPQEAKDAFGHCDTYEEEEKERRSWVCDTYEEKET